MDLRDLLSIRALGIRHRRALRAHTQRAQPLFEAMLEGDPHGLALAEHPLVELPAADRLAAASNEQVISLAIAAVGHLRKIPVNDTFRSLSLKAPRAYRLHFASIRLLEIGADAGLPFGLDETKLLLDIALNAPKVEGTADATIRHGSEWPDFAAQMITSRLLAPERLDLYDAAIGAAELLDGGLYDGVLAMQIVRAGQRLTRVQNPTYEIGEMHTRIQRVLQKPTTLLRVDR